MWYTVSTLSHERDDKHLTPAEVNNLVESSEDALSDVHDWLESHGVDRGRLSYSAAKDWIQVRLPVREIQRLLDTQYFIFEHQDDTQLVHTVDGASASTPIVAGVLTLVNDALIAAGESPLGFLNPWRTPRVTKPSRIL